MKTLAAKRTDHAAWARQMAEQYRRDAETAMTEYWRNRFLSHAKNMENEVEWAEQSAQYMQ